MFNKVFDLFKQKGVSSGVNSGGYSFIGNNFLSCGNVVLNENDKYNFLKINSDTNRSNEYIATKTAINGFILEDKNGEELDEQNFADEYRYAKQLFTLQTFDFWKRELITNTTISGENYFQPIYGVTNGGKISSFEPIDTRMVLKNLDKGGEIESFTVTSTFGKTETIPRDAFGWFLYRKDPLNPYNGFGVIDGIIFDLLSDREAGKTNYYTFENNGIPGAIFTLDPSISSPQAIKEAGDKITKKFQGSKNANKIAASPFIKDVKVLNISQRDLEYIGGREFASAKIASAFGLSVKLLGYPTKNGSFSELKEIRQEVHETTILGYERYIENIMNTLIQKFRDELVIDLSQYTIRLNSETFENQETIQQSQREDLKLGLLTPNQIMTQRKLPLIEGNFGNARFIANNINQITGGDGNIEINNISQIEQSNESDE